MSFTDWTITLLPLFIFVLAAIANKRGKETLALALTLVGVVSSIPTLCVVAIMGAPILMFGGVIDA